MRVRNPPKPTWQDYADDLYREPTRAWYRTWVAMVGVVVVVAVGMWFAVPFISAALVTDEDVRLEVRQTIATVQQDMEAARLGGDGTFTLPFPDNPHRTDTGVILAICLGTGNATYTITGYGIEGEYWNANGSLPGAISGPEPEPLCDLAAPAPATPGQ